MLQIITDIHEKLKSQVSSLLLGQNLNTDLLFVALLSEGHVILEGAPGTGKTFLVHVFSSCLDLDFNRIQFTPDLMPGDVLGTNLFNFHSNSFSLTKGPIFTQICLADEINRTPPKTQAALLQAMQERSVTIDGVTHQLDPAFMVIATQNPIENEGTYPLPEAQLDRFLFKLMVEYPSREQEVEMVKKHGHRSTMPQIEAFGIESIADTAKLQLARDIVQKITLKDELIHYIVDIIRKTREHPSLLAGASPRAANMLATAARAHAAIHGRDFVIPDDIKTLVIPTLGHRVVLGPAAELDGKTTVNILNEILSQTRTPK